MQEHGKPRTITFTLDGVSLTVTDAHQTAASILTLGGLDPAMYELAPQHGDGQPWSGAHPVEVHAGEAFLTVRVSAPVG